MHITPELQKPLRLLVDSHPQKRVEASLSEVNLKTGGRAAQFPVIETDGHVLEGQIGYQKYL